MASSPINALDNLFTPGLIAAQQPNWSQAELDLAVKELKSFPPLVFAGECDDLKSKVAQAAEDRKSTRLSSSHT